MPAPRDVDKILLSGIECYAFGGVSDAEREIGQRYRLDLELFLDTSAAGASDALEHTVHYGDVHDTAVGVLRAHPFKLVEAAAQRVASAVLRQYPVSAVTVRVAKLLPPVDGIVASAAVEIHRRREV
jgi:dihydroneopterin aldolase